MAEITYGDFPQETDYPIYSQQYLRDKELAQNNARAKAQPEKKRRIKKWMFWCMVLTALTINIFLILLDFIGIGEFINWIIHPVVQFGFIVWFWILGVKITENNKVFITMVVTAVIGFIPILGDIEMTIGIAVSALFIMAEDGDGMASKLLSKASMLKKLA